MKIVFFKNESHFHPRISYVWENAEKVELNPKMQNSKKLFALVLSIVFLAFSIFYIQELTSNRLLVLAILFLCLPIHELCHALFCWLLGRKVERINFFPYKQFFLKPKAYVKPAFNVWSKYQSILLNIFPIIMLSVIPAILSVFIAPLRPWLLCLALLNVVTSYSDIIDAVCLFRLPTKSLYFIDFILTIKNVDNPVIIHQLSVTPKLDKIHHRCFEYFDGKLTEKDQPCETGETMKLKQEFVKQFNI